MNLRKRALSVLLSAAMICNMGVSPVLAYAATGDTPIGASSIGASSICEHHITHTAECGYTEGTAGVSCTHTHTADCYSTELICGLTEEVVDSGSSSDAAHTHTQGCYKLVCTHVHDTACGYMEKAAGTPCIYECLICNPTNDKPLDSGAVSTPSNATKAVTLWQFVDPENNLIENTLALPGVNAQMQASFDDVVALLPTALTGTVEGAAEPATVNITGWVCESYKQDESGNWPISRTFAFAATLAKGYTATPVPTVMVELGGAKLLIGETGDFTVTGGTYGTSHKYEANTLTIMDGTPLTISGTTTADKIVVANGVTANVTLNGVSITSGTCAFEIAGTATCNLTLNGDNTLKSGIGKAGLQVSTDATVSINGTGSLNATGGNNSAGIGGGLNGAGGTVTINGGTVTATGGLDGAGIGGGYNGAGGTTTINGGTVTATGGTNSAGIGGTGGTVTINGGAVNANGTGNNEGFGFPAIKADSVDIHGGTITAISGQNAWTGTQDGISGTFTCDSTKETAIMVTTGIADKISQGSWSGVIFEGNSGKVYGTSVTLKTDVTIPSEKTLEIPSGTTLTIDNGVTLTNNGAIHNFGIIAGNGTIGGIPPINIAVVGAFTVTGGAKDTDYSYANNTLTIKSGTALTISTATPTTTDKIVVQSGVTANVTLDGVDIQFNDGDWNGAGTCAFDMTGATVNMTLKDGTTNILKSGWEKAGLQVRSGATLNIDGTGVLNATGGEMAAGIGGGASGGGGTITINDGTVNAIGRSGSSRGGAGIGGGSGGGGGTTTINGGTVTASGNGDGAGIGGGLNGAGGTIKINGGVVNAFGSGGYYEYGVVCVAAGIGGGHGSSGGTIEITGGTVKAVGGHAQHNWDEWRGMGIGDGYNGTGGTFSTGASGNAFIDTTGISDQSGKNNSSWGGIIFENNVGKVYGSPTLTTNAEIPNGKTLEIPSGTTLTINNGVTLTNNGAIHNYGTITNNGTIGGTPPINIAVVGEFTVTGGTKDVDYSYASPTLTIKSGTALTISTATPTAEDKIVVADGVTANVTLDGVDINVSATGKACAFEIAGTATCNLTLIGNNKLKSGEFRAGLQVSTGATVIIDGTGALNATGGRFGAGIGGAGNIGAGGTITINGGTVTATGRIYGAGIGGGDGGAGGTVTISGGTVTANGGQYGAGIGGGNYGTGGTFSTGASGNAFIVTTGIADQSGKINSSWNGVIFEGNAGKVYGTSVTLETNAEISSEKTLEIPSTTTLTINDGVTLTNNGIINNNGTITGSIGGTGTVNVPSVVAVSFSKDTPTYGEEIIITATAQKPLARGRLATINTVDFYLGDVASGTKLGTANVTDNAGKLRATLTITLSGTDWSNGFIIGDNTITADFGGSTGLFSSTGTNTLTVSKANRTISAPTVASKTDTTATLNAVTPSIGDGTVEYGYAQTNNSAGINNWQTGLAFSSLNAGATYYFFARVTGGTYYGDAISTSTQIVLDQTAEATPTATIDYKAEKLTGFTAGDTYIINDGTEYTDVAYIAIDADWMGRNIYIVKKGNGTTTEDSTAQILAIPARPTAPTTTLQITKTKNSIAITNTADYTGCEFSNSSIVWNDTGTFSGLTAGAMHNIYARVKAVADTSFASGNKSVVVTTIANDGSTTLKPNESIPTGDGAGTITNDGNKVTIDKDKTPSTPNTVITPPSGSDVTVKDDGTVTVPPNGTITTGNGPTVTLPNGGTADKDGNVSGGTNGSIIIGDNTITPPAGGTITTDKDGKTELPGGSTIVNGNTTVKVDDGTSGGSVDKDGNITLPGSGEITVKDKDGNTSTIKVPAAGGEVTVKNDGTVSAPGGSTVTPPDGKPSVTIPEGGGTVGGDGGITSNSTVTSVAVSPATVSIQVGNTQQLTATVTGTNSPVQTVTWTSSNPAAATVNASGLVTAVASGTATITAVSTLDTSKSGTAAVTVTSPSSGGSTDDDSGDSSGGTVVTPPATQDKPTPPTTVETGVKVKTDKDGNATATVPSKAVTNAIEKAQKEAKKNGTEKNGIAIVLNVNVKENANSLEITLSEASITALRNAKVTQLTINNGLTTMTFDLAALNALQGGEVKLTISKADVKSLSAEAQKAIGNRPVFSFKVTVGGKAVTDFKGGRIGLQMPYTRTTTELAGNLCGVFVDTNGKVAWLENSSYDALTSTLLTSTTHLSVYGVGYKENAPKFTDIEKHWAKNDIDFVVARGLLSGTGSTTFAPDQSMTRGMFVTALGRLAGVDSKKYQSTKFTDVKADAYYAPYVAWANSNNIVNGTSATTFTPDKAITRQEMAVMLVNYSKAIGYKLPSVHAEIVFADSANIGTWAKDAVKQTQMAGILMGKSGNKFDPTSTATRGEVSAMLRRFVELLVNTETAEGFSMNESGQWMYIENGKRVTGKKTIDGKSYTFDQYGVTTAMPPERKYLTYTVQKGDSFWGIAWKYKVSMFELAEVNGKTIFSMIYAGEELKIPD